MAKMPTTRRGRYLWYQERYKRRKRWCQAHRRRGTAAGRRQFTRERDRSGLQWQAPKNVKKIGPPIYYPFTNWTWELIPAGGNGKPPIWRQTGGWFSLYLQDRWHFAFIGAVRRRMKRYPRVKHLPLAYP